MKMMILTATAAALACALALGGCASTIKAIPEADRAKLLTGAADHIDKCDRHYWANTGVAAGLGAGAGFDINCKPQQSADLAAMVAAAIREGVAQVVAAGAAKPLPQPGFKPED